MENVDIIGKCSNPTVIAQIRANILKALEVFNERKQGAIPECFFNNIETLIRGEHNTVWGLLNAIREAYPMSELKNKNYFHLSFTNLPYSNSQLRKLELSLINWIYSLGLFRNLPHPPVMILDFEAFIKNGTLICDLVQIICRTKINGVFRNPKTDSTAISNIRKAFQVLRSMTKMSQR